MVVINITYITTLFKEENDNGMNQGNSIAGEKQRKFFEGA